MRITKKEADQTFQQKDILVDVFISYSRKDEAIAKNLNQLLINEGFAVWFDEKIYGGSDWENLLMTHLTAAKAIIVLWTKNSVQSSWVIKEAAFALRTKRLIPAVLDDCMFPPAFQSVQNVMLPGWNGMGTHPKLEQLLVGISQLAPPSRVDNVRPGFITDFLGKDTGLPAITGVADEFRYLHFSVIMNPARRLPWYVAYNLEPANKEVLRGNNWMPDPALPASFQPGNEHYRGTGFDRGHIISPATVSWGNLREAQLANRQSFFWTNTAPQHPEMNQGWWLKLEEWERSLVIKYKRAVGYAGPVLQNDDPLLRNVEQVVGRLRLRQNFKLPDTFWKLVLVKKGQVLFSAAFMLNQDELLKKRISRNTPVSTHSCTISDIELITGLEFSESIHQAKPLQL